MYCDRSSLTGFVVHVDVFVCICANCALRVFAVHCCCSVFLLPVEFLWRYASYYCVFYRYSAGFVIFDRLFVFFLGGVWNFCFLVFKRSVVCWCVFSAVVFLSRWALRLCFLCVMFTSVAFFCAYALKIKWGSGAIWSTRISRFGSDCCVLMECVALEYVRLRYFLRCRNAVPVFWACRAVGFVVILPHSLGVDGRCRFDCFFCGSVCRVCGQCASGGRRFDLKFRSCCFRKLCAFSPWSAAVLWGCFL